MSLLTKLIHKVKSKPLLLQSLWSMFARFAGVALNFAVILIITNRLPKADAGNILLLMTFVTGVALISRLGTDQLLMKEVASAHDTHSDFRGAFLKSGFQAVLFLSLAFIVLWLLASPFILQRFFDNGIALRDLMLASIGILFFNLVILNSTYLKAIKQTVYGVLGQNALPAITFLVLIALFWRSFDQNQHYINLYTFSLVLAGVIAMLITRHFLLQANGLEASSGHFVPEQNIAPGFIRLIKQSLPLAPVSIFSYLMLFADTIMVGWFLPNDQVADYSVAAKISYIVLFFLQALEATIYPRLLNIYHHNKQQLSTFFWQSTTLVVGVVLSVTLFMYLLADWLLIAFGKDYIVAKQALGLLLLAQFFRAASITFSFMFIIQEKVRYLNIILVTALIANLVFNVILIQRYGIEGAATATLIANGTLLILVLALFYWHKLLDQKNIQQGSTP